MKKSILILTMISVFGVFAEICKAEKPLKQKPGVIHFDAAKLINIHKTYSVIEDDTAVSGSCVKQEVKHWTIGQGVGWGVGDLLKKALEKDVKYKLRVRIKVDKIGNKGEVFKIVYLHYYDPKSWRAKTCSKISFSAADVPNGKWKWYELPLALKYNETGRAQVVYVVTGNNPKNISAVYVDAFELIPEK